MDGPERLFVVLPCYNEERNIPQLLRRIEKTCISIDYEVVVVNDGSRDKTPEVLSQLRKGFPIIILTHRRNRGLSRALQTGLSKVIELAELNDVIAVMDADLTHDPSHLERMLMKLHEGFDVVVSSRYISAGGQLGVSAFRVFLSRLICVMLRCVATLPVKDVTGGYRCYRVNVLKKIRDRYGSSFIDSSGFEVSAELLIKSHRLGAKITEIPFVLDYSKKRGASKMNVMRTALNYLRLIENLRRW